MKKTQSLLVTLILPAVTTHIIEYEASKWVQHRDRQLHAEFERLRATNWINVASWCAKEQLEADTDRHREGGDGPW